MKLADWISLSHLFAIVVQTLQHGQCYYTQRRWQAPSGSDSFSIHRQKAGGWGSSVLTDPVRDRRLKNSRNQPFAAAAASPNQVAKPAHHAAPRKLTWRPQLACHDIGLISHRLFVGIFSSLKLPVKVAGHWRPRWRMSRDVVKASKTFYLALKEKPFGLFIDQDTEHFQR